MKRFGSARVFAAALALAGVVGTAHAELNLLEATASGPTVQIAKEKVQANLQVLCNSLGGTLFGSYLTTSIVGNTVTGTQYCDN